MMAILFRPDCDTSRAFNIPVHEIFPGYFSTFGHNLTDVTECWRKYFSTMAGHISHVKAATDWKTYENVFLLNKTDP